MAWTQPGQEKRKAQGQGSGRARAVAGPGSTARKGHGEEKVHSRPADSAPASPAPQELSYGSTGRKHPHRGEGAAGKFKAYKSLKRMKKMLETNEVLFSTLDKIILGNK